VLARLEEAVPLARALVAGGIRVIEVTLRTPVALEAMRLMREAGPERWSAPAPSPAPGNSPRPSAPAPCSRSRPDDSAARRGDRHAGIPVLPGVMTPPRPSPRATPASRT